MFHYFGYGSNLNLTSLRAKGVEPQRSTPAVLLGWRLRFNVRHWFRHEGGVGNIQPGDPGDRVLGLVHRCEDEHLPLLDLVESYGSGYDRVHVDLETAAGLVRAVTYVGIPSYLDDACLPTRRYLNIILQGATRAGLDPVYIERLRNHPTHPDPDYPPFDFPAEPDCVFTRRTLARHPLYTGLAGGVFDMSDAAPRLDCLRELLGGRDMTLFHLKRHDSSDGSETLQDIRHGRISEAGRQYLNAYLHEYNAEFRFAGRYDFAADD